MVWETVAGIAGDLLGGLLGNSAQSSANRTNIMLNRENRDWMERMSNTGYARATQDMLSAGLNPMLAYSQGPASTPSNSAATVEPVNAMSKAASSAGAKAMQMLSLQKLKEDTRLTKEQADQAGITTDEMRATSAAGTGSRLRGMHLEMEQREANVELTKATRDLNRSNITVRNLEAALANETFGYNVASAKERANLINRQVDFQEIQTMLSTLDIPEKQVMARWFDAIGTGSPITKMVMSIGSWLHMILRGR